MVVFVELFGLGRDKIKGSRVDQQPRVEVLVPRTRRVDDDLAGPFALDGRQRERARHGTPVAFEFFALLVQELFGGGGQMGLQGRGPGQWHGELDVVPVGHHGVPGGVFAEVGRVVEGNVRSQETVDAEVLGEGFGEVAWHGVFGAEGGDGDGKDLRILRDVFCGDD